MGEALTSLFNLLSAAVAFVKTLFGGGQAKDPLMEVRQHDQTVAEKQAADLADRTRPGTAERLSRGDF